MKNVLRWISKTTNAATLLLLAASLLLTPSGFAQEYGEAIDDRKDSLREQHFRNKVLEFARREAPADARLHEKFSHGGQVLRLRQYAQRRGLGAPAREFPLLDNSDQSFVGRVAMVGGARLEAYHNNPFTGAVAMAEFSGPGLVRIEAPVVDRNNESVVDAIPVEFYQFHVKPALTLGVLSEPFILNVGGAIVGFQHCELDNGDHAGKVYVLNGQFGGEKVDWMDTGIYFGVSEDGAAARPRQYAVRVDQERHEWDLYVNNQLLFGGIALSEVGRGIWAYSPANAFAEVGGLSVTSYNPLFTDRDKDGIEDVFEEALGFSSQINDRQASDGAVTNLQAFVDSRRRYIKYGHVPSIDGNSDSNENEKEGE